MAEPIRDSKKIDAAIAVLWERFRPTNEARLQALQTAVRKAAAGELDGKTRRHAECEAHKLAGAAGSYGFPHISRLARECEWILQGEGSMVAEDVAGLSALVNQLERAIAQRIPSPHS